MSREDEGLVRSVHVRLVRHARELGVDPNLVLTRYAVERFLYRLSVSPHADRFVLKGALLLLVWMGETFRPTRDVDLLGLGDFTDDSLANLLAEICTKPVVEDGITYEVDTIRVADIRPEDTFGVQRVSLRAHLGRARLRVLVDVGVGDVVAPEPEWLDYPSLLHFPAPRLRCYPPEVLVAEKLHAMVLLGARNSRLRDFYDVYALSRRQPFQGRRLGRALHSTFERRRTPIPRDRPVALAPAFATTQGKRAQWAAFLAKNRIDTPAPDLDQVVKGLADFLGPPLQALRSGDAFDAAWPPGGPWS